MSDEPPDDPWPVLDYGEPIISSRSKLGSEYKTQSKPVQIAEKPNLDIASRTQKLEAKEPQAPDTKSNPWFSNRNAVSRHIPQTPAEPSEISIEQRSKVKTEASVNTPKPTILKRQRDTDLDQVDTKRPRTQFNHINPQPFQAEDDALTAIKRETPRSMLKRQRETEEHEEEEQLTTKRQKSYHYYENPQLMEWEAMAEASIKWEDDG